MVPANSHRISLVPRYSGYWPLHNLDAYGTFTPYGQTFQFVLLKIMQLLSVLQPQCEYTLVWANPRSLATTCGITFVFFSSSYLDVSVQRVVPLAGDRSSIYRVSPFGHLWIKDRLRLPIAFRSLPRPSSSLRAKASPIRPYSLPSLRNHIAIITLPLLILLYK